MTILQGVRLTGVALTLASLLFPLLPLSPVQTPTQAKNSREVAQPFPSAQRPQSTQPSLGTRESATRADAGKAYMRLPLSFEPNRGQADREVKYLSRGHGYTLFLSATGAVMALHKRTQAEGEQASSSAQKSTQTALLKMSLLGANRNPTVEGVDEQAGKSNYLIGNDRKKWRTDIPRFSRVRYEEVYPGIDMVYYGTSQRELEYDFIVAPGARPDRIKISFEGAQRISLDEKGDLVLETKAGPLVQRAPVIYQETKDGKQMVSGRYVMKAEREVGFEVAAYDVSKPLVIDPQLIYATFYGGSNDDVGRGIAVDAGGNAYIAGETNSVDLLLVNAFQGTLNPGDPGSTSTDAFVTKLNASGTGIIYSTYLGGSKLDVANAIAVTSAGRACITGVTDNSFSDGTFPTTPGRFQGNGSGLFVNRELDAFMTVLSADGSDLFYSTYFGGFRRDTGDNAGIGNDEGLGIAVDAANKVYITGKSDAPSLPTKNAFQNAKGGGRDAFIAKFDPSESGNSSLVYSSFLGGTGGEFGNAVAVTPGGVAFFVGVTGSFNFPTKSSSSLPPFQTNQGGVNDSFIAKVSPSGALIYSTYFGGNERDEAQAVAVDNSERAYVTGVTLSTGGTFPLRNAFNSTKNGSFDAFVTKFNADGTALFYSTFLGNDVDAGRGIAVDAGGNAYVTGNSSNDLSPVNGFPPSVPAGTSFVAKLEASNAAGTNVPKLLYLDSFGSGSVSRALAVDKRGNVYMTGETTSSFTTTPGVFQSTFTGGTTDAFAAKVNSTFPDTVGIFRPSTGQFLLRNSNAAGPPDITITFGQAGDLPIAGDWNGDGVDDVGVFRPSTEQFLLRVPGGLKGATIITLTDFGQNGDLPVAGDWNGDGIDTVGVFRPTTGEWVLTNEPNTNGSSPPINFNFAFGLPGDVPLTGDWNGDGIDTIGVLEGGVGGNFLLRNSNSAGGADLTPIPFGGQAIDQFSFGDWNGDGIDSIGDFRDGTFFLINQNIPNPPTDLTFNFGQAGDIPLNGDWDGLAAPANPPNVGVNNPSKGASSHGETQVFTTTCSDPDGWRDIHTIDFQIARSTGNGQGVPLIFWAQFDENNNLIRFYDPDTDTWSEGQPGSNVVLSSRFAELHLAGTSVVGSGPTGPSVQITWEVVFKDEAVGTNYKQFLRIEDDAGASTATDKVGAWSVTP